MVSCPIAAFLLNFLRFKYFYFLYSFYNFFIKIADYVVQNFLIIILKIQ